MKNLLSKQETVEATLNALRPVLEEIFDRADKGEAVSTKKMLMRRILRNHQIRFGSLISKEMMSIFDELETVPAPAPVVVEETVVVDSVDFDELTPEQQAEIEKQIAEDLADETTETTEEVKEEKPTSLKEAAKEIKKKKTKKA